MEKPIKTVQKRQKTITEMLETGEDGKNPFAYNSK